MPLHPTIAAMMAQLAASGRPAVSAGTPAEGRQLLSAARIVYGNGPALPRVETVSIPTRSGSIGARLFAGPGEPKGLLVYLHGGGWVLGTLDDFDAVARLLAQRSGCALLLVDYRLAPEAPFPAAVEDAEDAVLWASHHMAELVGRTVPLVIAGDSAGGNLAAIVAAELAATVPTAAQVLIYPVTDGDFDTESYSTYGTGGLLTRADMQWFFGLYAPGAARSETRLHPAARTDLKGAPRAHVVTAEYDVLRDEGEAYARQLQAAGVPTTARRYDGLPHGFIRMHNLVDTVDAAISDIAGVIAEACEPQRR